MALRQISLVNLDAKMPSEAAALADLLAGPANGGFAVDDDGRIIVWSRAQGGEWTVRLIRDVPAAQELLRSSGSASLSPHRPSPRPRAPR